MPSSLIASRYRILSEIGRGAQTIVLLAQDEVANRRVALRQSDEARHHFARRARLKHPSIANVLDVFTTDGTSYLVEEFVPGETLDRCEALSLSSILSIARRLLQALYYLHRHGLIHRDVKPANILIEDRGGEPWPILVDFGLAHTLDEEVVPAGSLGLVAPEVLRGGVSGIRADLFSAGITLLTRALNRPIDARLSVENERIPELIQQAPPALRPVLKGLTSADPKSRFASASDALDSLPDQGSRAILPISEWPVIAQQPPFHTGCRLIAQLGPTPHVVCVTGSMDSGRRALAETLAREAVRRGRWAETQSDEVPNAPLVVRRVDLDEDADRTRFANVIANVESNELQIVTALPATARRLAAALAPDLCTRLETVLVSPSDLRDYSRYGFLPHGIDCDRLYEESAGHLGSIDSSLLREKSPTLSSEEGAIFLSCLVSPLESSETEAIPDAIHQSCRKLLERGEVYWKPGAYYQWPSLLQARQVLIGSTPESVRHADRVVSTLLDLHHPYRDFHELMAGNPEKLSDALRHVLLHEGSTPNLEFLLFRIVHCFGVDILNEEPSLFLELGYRLLKAGRYETLRDAIRDANTTPPIAALRGRMLSNAGEFENALPWLRLAEADSSLDSHEPTLDLARAHLHLSQWEEALSLGDHIPETLDQACEDAAERDRIRAMAHFRLGRVDHAIALAQNALNNVSDKASSLALGLVQNIAMMKRHQGKWEEASILFDHASQGLLRIGDIESAIAVAINSAIAHQNRGAYQRALEVATQAEVTARTGDLVRLQDLALTCRGITWALLGAIPRALVDLQRAEQNFSSRGMFREACAVQIWRLRAQLALGKNPTERLGELTQILRTSIEKGLLAEGSLAWSTLLKHDQKTSLPLSTRVGLLRAADEAEGESIRLEHLRQRLESGLPPQALERTLNRLRKQAPSSPGSVAFQAYVLLARHTPLKSEACAAAARAWRLVRHSESSLEQVETLLDLFSIRARLRTRGSTSAYARRLRQNLSELDRISPAAELEDGDMETWTERLHEIREQLDRLEETRDRTRAADLLVPVSAAIMAIHDESRSAKDRLGAVLKEAMRLTTASRGIIRLLETSSAGSIEASLVYADGTYRPSIFEVSRSVLSEVLETGKAKFTYDALEDPRYRSAVSVEEFRLSSIACVPIESGAHLIGALYLDNPFKKGVFQQSSIDALEIFTRLISLSLTVDDKKREISRLNQELTTELDKATHELETARQALAQSHPKDVIVYRDESMDRLLKTIQRLAKTDVPVFIRGDTGTGKELIAKRLHEFSPRRSRPFVSENCAAIPETLLESVLFGHVKGAFTGAHRDKPGLFRLAHGGTLFLDEIADLPTALQGKLLRVLQEGQLRPLGGDELVQVDVRIVTAAQRDLKEMVDAGSFRRDLYYRIVVASAEVPRLADRREDIPILIQHFLSQFGDPSRRVSREALQVLKQHDWPGNVRELVSVVRSALVLSSGAEIGVDDLPEELSKPKASAHSRVPSLDLRELERLAILEALQEAQGNRNKAAQLLGISRSAIFKKLKRFGIGKHTDDDQSP